LYHLRKQKRLPCQTGRAIAVCSTGRKGTIILSIIASLLTFIVLACAAKEIGAHARRFGLPLISGFLLVGILAGPYLLGIVANATVERLRFVDAFALSFIAFAAGGEFELATIRSALRPIVAILLGQTLILVVGTVAYIMLADSMPFMQGLSPQGIVAVGLIGGTIMVARSPSSAYAIIKELRAHGPFTQMVLGVTVLMDVLVIILFTVMVALADMLIGGKAFHLSHVLLLIGEMCLDVLFGLIVWQMLRAVFALPASTYVKAALMFATGYGIYALSALLRDFQVGAVTLHIVSEPLLVGLIGGFLVANYTPYKTEFRQVIEDAAPLVFIVFFTLVGLSLELDVLAQVWGIALILLVVRIVGIYFGCFFGSMMAGDGVRQKAILGMTFITQAGVSVGLAKEVGVEFPAWGNEFATLAIAVVVLNQCIGPPLLKWAIRTAGEAHTRAETPGFDGVRDVIIFGVDDQSLSLARQLATHRWQVKLADLESHRLQPVDEPGIDLYHVDSLTPEAFRALEMDRAEAIVAMFDDDTNYTICEIAYEHFGTAHLVVRLYDRSQIARFRELGVSIIDPGTALVSLLDHAVRSPTAASLIMGEEEDRDVIEILVANDDLEGVALRDLGLPPDIVILSIRRNHQPIVVHGYTRLAFGDEVTVVGTPESLEDVQWRFEPYSDASYMGPEQVR
jgi:Trk K+ transport system NAD-binding subunit/Kef-type K+ transport system membrane component KefB